MSHQWHYDILSKNLVMLISVRVHRIGFNIAYNIIYFAQNEQHCTQYHTFTNYSDNKILSATMNPGKNSSTLTSLENARKQREEVLWILQC